MASDTKRNVEERKGEKEKERAHELERERRREKERRDGNRAGAAARLFITRRAVRRSYPPPRSLATARVPHSLARPLPPSPPRSTDSDPHTPFHRWRAYIPRRSGRPRAHCDDQEGLVTSVPVSLFLQRPSVPPSTSLNPRATSRRSLYFLPPLRILPAYSSLSLCRPFFFLV